MCVNIHTYYGFRFFIFNKLFKHNEFFFKNQETLYSKNKNKHLLPRFVFFSHIFKRFGKLTLKFKKNLSNFCDS